MKFENVSENIIPDEINNKENNPLENESKKITEHLRSGVPHILSCVGTQAQFIKTEKSRSEVFEFYDSKNDVPEGYDIVDVNYNKSHEDLELEGFKNQKLYSYVISPIDNLPKISKNFLNCIGFLAVGYKKDTKENISFMSHQNPVYFLSKKDQQESFIKDFNDSLNDLKLLCDEKTIDAVIFGGNYIRKNKDKSKGTRIINIAKDILNIKKIESKYRFNYLKSIDFLEREAKKILDFEPEIIMGPKLGVGHENVYFDNNERRLYISRPEVVDETTDNFLPSDLKEKLKEL